MNRRHAGACFAVLLLPLLMAAAAPPARAAGERAGDVVVIGGDTLQPVTGGDGEAPFSLRLPDGAACPGDSLEGQYRVQSFLVPEEVDPGTLVYQGLRPQAEGAWALYDLSTRTYMNQPTDMATEPGGEGRVINVPSFSHAVFEPGMIAPGRYEIGIACSLFSKTERYWSTTVDIEADDDDIAGIAWTVASPPDDAVAPGTNSPVRITLTVAGLLLAVALLTGATLRRRRVSAVGADGPVSA